MKITRPWTVFLCVLPLLTACTSKVSQNNVPTERQALDVGGSKEAEAVKIHFLEIVTPEVDATCDALEKVQGVSFGAPIPELGNARTAALDNGGRISVRGPMRETESPVVRPYLLVEDIEAAVGVARAAGAEIAMAPTQIPGQGTFAIYILGGIQHGLWQL